MSTLRICLRRKALARLGALPVALVFGRAQAEDEANLAGTWRGPWYLGMSSGIATLVLEGTGAALSGTLQLTNNETFGEEPVRLASASVQQGTLRFKVTGANGNPLDAQIPLSADVRMLKGPARYGGYKLRFELVKAQRP